MKSLLCLWCCMTMALPGQETIDPAVRSLRVVGQGMRGFPVVMDGYGIRIEFDGTLPQPVDYRIRVRHLDANGRETENVFVNDPLRLFMLTPIPYQEAPVGVRTWRWHYATVIPGPKGLERLPHAGYYRGWIEEAESGRAVATFTFVRADRDVSHLLTVRQRRLPSAIAPYDQAVAVRLDIPLDSAWWDQGPVQPMLIHSVDVVKNREWSRRSRVEVYDDDPNTWVEGSGTNRLTYVAGGILPGNEYRQIDLRSLEDYPKGDTLRSRSGADISRFFFPGRPDHNGLPAYSNAIGGEDEELTEFQFLWSGEDEYPPEIAVVGEFNGWTVRPEWTMAYDRGSRRHVLRTLLRRGRYDYQYVLNGKDWIRLEGNDWTTKNIYTAFVVYHEQREGGYDRVVGAAQVESTGAVAGGRTRDTN